jgi:Secretion system C-terminal sorting domain
MQTLNFTPKLLRQRRFLSFLLPLFALFAGLGSPLSVVAQAITDNSVTLNIKGATTNLNTQNPTAGPGVFNGANLGTFNLSTPSDVLSLEGATLAINDPNGSYNNAVLFYRVYPTGGPTTTFSQVQLGPGTLSGGVRTYSVSGLGRNLLASLTGGAGTQYNFNVFFQANDFTNFTDPQLSSAPPKTATFTVTGAPIAPTNIGGSDVFINTTGATTPNTTYGASSANTPKFNGANLGTYDINTGQLTLNGGDLTTFESNGDVVTGSPRLLYRIIKPAQNGQPVIVFNQSTIALTQLTVTTDANGNTTRTFSNNTALRNLIAGLANSGIGNYQITVSYEADIISSAGNLRVVRDDNGGAGYVATFSTNGTPIQTDTWTGNVNDDWFNSGNWDLNRIPDSNTNVVVPDFGTGNTKPYPNINGGVTFKASNGATGNPSMIPTAFSRNLNLLGSTQAQRTILRLIIGRLQVFGDFINLQDSFIQRSGSVFELAGTDQSFTGGSNFDAVEISGGGTKVLTGTMTIAGRFTFLPSGGVVTTDVSRVNSNFIQFADRSATAPQGAQLQGENETNYIRGFVLTNRSNVLANELDPNGSGAPYLRSYSNLGMRVYFKGTNNPGDVLITRNTAESYTPIVTTNGTQSARYGIRRIFGVRPSSPNTNNGGLIGDVYFTYRDAELTNLGPQGTGTVPEPNLGLFISTSSGNQFGGLGRDALDQVNNILTKNNVRTFATFTLGDINNPLPVSLIAFDAKRAGVDALVTWQTASEQNNKGFNVQVSSDGKNYRTIAFVGSESPNSNAPKAYSFTDTEKNKAGARYYRLEQLDLNGKSTFYAPRAVAFEGKAVEAGIVAYPNPLTNEILHLSLNSAVSGPGYVRILDMTGRQVGQRELTITIGTNDVPVEAISSLKTGLYLLNVTLPSGESKTLKIVKQ